MKPITKLLFVFMVVSFFPGCTYFAALLMPRDEGVAVKFNLPKEGNPLKETDKALIVDIMGDGKLLCYYKNQEQSIPANAAMDIKGLGKAVKEGLAKYKKDFVVIVRPTDKAEYKELVNILDELTITHATRYAVQEWTPPQK